jgi:hypothetical protein
VVTLGALAPVGASAIFAASIVAGGVSGLITGMATAYINGGSLRDVLQAGVTGSIMGMMTAVATAGISALVSKIPVVAKFNWGRLVYTSNSKLVTEGGWHLFSGGVFKNAGDVLSNVGNMLDNIMSSSVQTGLASGVTSSFTSSVATNVFTTSGLTASLDGGGGSFTSNSNGGSVAQSGGGIADVNGGFIDNPVDFETFMYEQAKNNPIEVAAFQLNDGKYYIQPWNLNGEGYSVNNIYGIPGYQRADVVAQFHTHPNSSGPSYSDAAFSAKYGIPVYTMGANGNMFVVSYPLFSLIPIWGIFKDGIYHGLYYGTKIK